MFLFNAKNNIHNIIKTVETPITSIRLVALDRLYSLANSKKIKVILEGVGGDELLGGYQYNWLPGYIDNNLMNLNPEKLIYKIFSKKNIRFAGIENLINYIYCLNSEGNFTSDGSPYLFFNFFKKDFIDYYLKTKKNLENDDLKNFNLLQKSQFRDIRNIHMPRTLNYIDKIAMSNSIETRLPYLDHELFEYCFGLPSNFKLKNNIQRFIWKSIFKKNISQKKKKDYSRPAKRMV